MSGEWAEEAVRVAIEDVVNHAFEAGFTSEDIRNEVEHCIETYEGEE